ncbi:MAG: type II toxin-antitoxin system HicB family antitoxin [Phycisphaerae bacterium]
MKRQKVTVLIEQDEDGYYVASIPALRSCYTQAKSPPVLRKRIEEVIKLSLAHEKPAKQQFVAVEQLEISS